MPLQALPADEADMARAVAIEKAAYGPNPVSSVLFPGPNPGRDENKRVGEIMALYKDPACKCAKVIDTDLPDEPTIAFAMWYFWTSPHEGPSFPNRTYGPACNADACKAFFGGMGKRRDELMQGKSYAYLKMLVTDPKHQRRGAGLLLMKWGIEQADHLKLPIYLESSPEGFHVYKKAGLEVIETLKVDLSPWGGPEDTPIPLMKRDAKEA